jgi:tetratricopeptide (TPR) repeat protein
VQLIEANSDRELWADTYDRPLDDVFAVQSEIAGSVASALHASLTPQESVALNRAPTKNQKAYDLFLRGDYLLRIARLNFTVANVPEAIELFRQAVVEDPRFALAYARLSLAESYLRFSGDGPKDSLPDQTQLNAEKALTLQPDLMEAHLALAYCAYWGRLDYAQALQHLARAQALAPKNTEVLTTIGIVYRRQLRFDEAIAAMKLAAEYDPGNPDVFYQLGLTYDWAGRYDNVQSAYEHALALNPDNEAFARLLAQFLRTHGGDMERVRKLLRGRSPSSQLDLAETYMDTRDFETAIHLIEELPADSPGFSEYSKDETLGVALYRAGQNQRARPWLERARDLQRVALAAKTLTPRQIFYHSCSLAEIEVALGDRDAAIQLAESIAHSGALTRDPIAAAYYRYCLAWIYARAGRNAEAIALLSQMLKSGTVKSAGLTPYLVRLDPDWDPIRGDPRFQDLLKEYPAEPRSN